jgi:fructan beta-fructosidase
MTDFRIVIDRSSIEIFIDGGRYVMTEQVFPTLPYNEIRFVTEDKLDINSFNINEIKSIWNHE